ncbi:unnamed protein product [Cuscuta epithymum]|uniref:CCHC-type domain-containing protein n=1 Tax=Cuscuta epithymum TaxID=186058 RepID=A0AAV0BY91_9ASTE|nr:unnamed protein product [Cuscuta epithymum]
MEGRGMATRNNPRGQTPVTSEGASQVASRGARGGRRGRGGRGGRGGHRAQTVSDGHVSSVHGTHTEDYDSTYVPETGHEETPYDGGDTYTDDDNDESDAKFAQMGELFEWYQKEKLRRDLRRQARRASQGASGHGSRGASVATPVASQGMHGGGFCVRISKYLKEARALGCKSFDGKGDISVAADWIKKLNEAARDMQIGLDIKLTVATRLLEGVAAVWWEGVEGKFHGETTWEKFEVEFYNQYYSEFEKNQKRKEYMTPVQEEDCSVRQLEQRFRDLARYIPEYAMDENRMANHFWDTLQLDIRDRATYNHHMTFSEIVDQGLLGEAKWNERKKRDAEEAKKRRWGNSGPQDHSRKHHAGNGRSFRAPEPPAKKSKGPGGQGHSSGSVRPPRCPNCNTNHSGKCNEPPRCYKCGSTSHLKLSCPMLSGGGPSGAVEAPTSGRGRAGPSQGGTGRGGPTASNAASVNQGRTQARVYAMTEADAQANPDSIAG